MQGIGGLLAPAFRIAHFMADAVQKLFDLPLGRVKLLDQLALLDKAEFQLRQRPQFPESFLTQACGFLGSRA